MSVIKGDELEDGRVCARCGIQKSAAEFYRNKGGKNGLYSLCKECMRERYRLHAEDNRESIRKYLRDWSREHREYHQRRMKKYKENNPMKIETKRILMRAIRAGLIPRARECHCFVCGTCTEMGDVMQHHHVDYSKPLEVIPVCARCHKRWHVARGIHYE